MPTCNTTVTTPTGYFTYFDEEVTHFQAKLNYIKIRQLLAPITSLSDVDALHTVIDKYNPECKFNYWSCYKYMRWKKVSFVQ